MNEEYWKGRWERSETGWHQTEVEPNLVKRFGDLTPTRVLVPLCGKSHDLTWLVARGHEVVGVELSEKACEAYFSENALTAARTIERGAPVYRAGRLTILNMNFFALTPALLGPPGSLGAIYDRAALIALPPDVRPRYAAHLTSLVKACGADRLRFLQIVLERTPPDDGGPPFSVTASELARLYGTAFKPTLLSRELVDMPGAKTEECVYDLSLVRSPPREAG